jgi:hypothetical protein
MQSSMTGSPVVPTRAREQAVSRPSVRSSRERSAPWPVRLSCPREHAPQQRIALERARGPRAPPRGHHPSGDRIRRARASPPGRGRCARTDAGYKSRAGESASILLRAILPGGSHRSTPRDAREERAHRAIAIGRRGSSEKDRSNKKGVDMFWCVVGGAITGRSSITRQTRRVHS